MEKNSLGLMAFWSDIDADYTLRYQEWHNCEHVPERVSIAGFNRGCRYRAKDGRPHFLMYYETDAPNVLNSAPYLAALNAPTSWTKEALKHFRNPERNIYRLLSTKGQEDVFVSPWLTCLRFNLGVGSSPEQLQEWIEGLAKEDEITRVRLYEVDEDISAIMTSERKIYGGGPGAQRYLVMVEQTTPSDLDTMAGTTANAFKALTRAWQDGRCDNYWLEIAQEKRIMISQNANGERA